MTFEELGLSDPLIKAVKVAGYDTPTEIQIEAIPRILAGKDILGCAQTGTGKTAAFALPTIQRLLKTSLRPPRGGKNKSRRGIVHELRCLVLAPTRELAGQISENFREYSHFTRLRQTVVFGGVGPKPQIQRLQRGVDILIATPGRLLDLHGKGHLELDQVQTLIIDEADMLFDMGFIRDLERIVKLTPPKRQTLLFSATIPAEVQQQAAQWLRNPHSIEITPEAIPIELINQKIYFIERGVKDQMLIQYLCSTPRGRTMVFVRTRMDADRVGRNLNKVGLTAVSLHGEKAQAKRKRAITDFKSEEPPILVATDVAARGLDISSVSHVINYAVPEFPEIYIHRVGRTGRAGAKGEAITLCSSDERYHLGRIEELVDMKLPTAEWPFEDFPDLPHLEKAYHRKKTGHDPRRKQRWEKRSTGKHANGSSEGRQRKPKKKRKSRGKAITQKDIQANKRG
jgi:ATP-dependent RNA helicase RhlE